MEKFGIIIISLVIAFVLRLIIQLIIPLEFLAALGPFAIIVLWIPVISADLLEKGKSDFNLEEFSFEKHYIDR